MYFRMYRGECKSIHCLKEGDEVQEIVYDRLKLVSEDTTDERSSVTLSMFLTKPNPNLNERNKMYTISKKDFRLDFELVNFHNGYYAHDFEMMFGDRHEKDTV